MTGPGLDRLESGDPLGSDVGLFAFPQMPIAPQPLSEFYLPD